MEGSLGECAAYCVADDSDTEEMVNVCPNRHVMHTACLAKMIGKTPISSALGCPLCRDPTVIHRIARFCPAVDEDDTDDDEDEIAILAHMSSAMVRRTFQYGMMSGVIFSGLIAIAMVFVARATRQS